MFPTPLRDDVAPPRDAIVLEAPQGAKLQFDEFRPERGVIGRITRGEFPGPITIRSDMREPGPDDDLLIETADLSMNTKLLYSTAPVRFRMGRNVGGGNELEIRFLDDEHVQTHDTGSENRRLGFAGNWPRSADAIATRNRQPVARKRPGNWFPRTTWEQETETASRGVLQRSVSFRFCA